MKRIFFCAVFAAFIGMTCADSLHAQTNGSGSIGDIGSSGGSSTGTTGNTGTNSASTGSSSLTFDEAGVTPVAQEIDRSTVTGFAGYPSDATFIGREQSFQTTYDRTGNSTTSSTRSASRNSMASRSSRTSMSGMTRTSSSNSGQVRAQTTMDFQFTTPEIDFRTTALRNRVTRLPSLRLAPEQVDISIERQKGENIATLTGTVASARDRKLLQNLLLLEPGIDRVDNRLEIATTPGKVDRLPQLDPAAEK